MQWLLWFVFLHTYVSNVSKSKPKPSENTYSVQLNCNITLLQSWQKNTEIHMGKASL